MSTWSLSPVCPAPVPPVPPALFLALGINFFSSSCLCSSVFLIPASPASPVSPVFSDLLLGSSCFFVFLFAAFCSFSSACLLLSPRLKVCFYGKNLHSQPLFVSEVKNQWDAAEAVWNLPGDLKVLKLLLHPFVVLFCCRLSRQRFHAHRKAATVFSPLSSFSPAFTVILLQPCFASSALLI